MVKLRTKRPDKILKQIVEALKRYEAAHPRAEVEAYRQNSVSVRIRIIDPDFEGMSRAAREDLLWPLLEQLPEEVMADVSLLLLLTPKEAKRSFASLEFDDPVPSRL
jgi:stress-induced morphogen